MNFLSKMERKYGKYAIKNLPLIIVICYAIGYLLISFAPEISLKLMFSPADVIVGHQYWRLFTWIFTPADTLDLLSVIMLFFFYSFASSLERGIGCFMFNIYILGGWLFNTIAVMGVSLFNYFRIGDSDLFYVWGLYNYGTGMMVYMQYSILLGFALIFSESIVLLSFILPIKASWLAYIDMVLLAAQFVAAGRVHNVINQTSIIAFVLNFFILYLLMRSYSRGHKPSAAQMKRRRAYQQQMREAERGSAGYGNDTGKRQDKKEQIPVGITRHKCAVCGRSEKDDPDLEFRFCSKCKGNYEYCNEHLFSHEHVK